MKYPQRWQISLQPRSSIRASQFGQMKWIFSSRGSGSRVSFCSEGIIDYERYRGTLCASPKA
jgi:hypothetical protein